MKRILTVFLSLTLVISCFLGFETTVRGESNTGEETTLTPDTTSGNTQMSVQATTISQPVYTVTIPIKVDFGSITKTKVNSIKTKPMTITANGISNLFANQQKLVVTVTSKNNYHLSDGAETPNMLSYNFYTAYTDENTNTPISMGQVLEIEGTAENDMNLEKTVNGVITMETKNIKKAGSYTDILTFTVGLQEVKE